MIRMKKIRIRGTDNRDPKTQIQFYAKKNGSGALYLDRRVIFEFYWINISDNVNSILFCFHTFGGIHSIDVIDQENQPGSGTIQIESGALGLTEDI